MIALVLVIGVDDLAPRERRVATLRLDMGPSFLGTHVSLRVIGGKKLRSP
jgi:hypothetical protein